MTESHAKKTNSERTFASNLNRFGQVLLFGAALNTVVGFLYFYQRELVVPEWLAFIYQSDEWLAVSGRALFVAFSVTAVASFLIAVAYVLKPHFGWAVIFFVVALIVGEITRNSFFLLTV